MEQLSRLAAAFLEIEDEHHNASLAIASVAVADGPFPGQQDFADAISARLPMMPRYRQEIRRVPFDLSAPMWIEDQIFAPRQHFFRVWHGPRTVAVHREPPVRRRPEPTRRVILGNGRPGPRRCHPEVAEPGGGPR
jgi:hypothetical protein